MLDDEGHAWMKEGKMKPRGGSGEVAAALFGWVLGNDSPHLGTGGGKVHRGVAPPQRKSGTLGEEVWEEERLVESGEGVGEIWGMR